MNDEELLKAFQKLDKRLDEFNNEKKSQNEKYEKMTEKELTESLANDYEEALKKAVANNIQVAIIPDKEDSKKNK